MSDSSASPERRKELLQQIQNEWWWLTIPLGDGLFTPGAQTYESIMERMLWKVMPDFKGKTVLDIGCAEGFFSFCAEHHRARHVVAVDVSVEAIRRFRLAHEYLGSKAEYHLTDVSELSPEQFGTFDIVLFLGVLYHTLHPLLAVERVKAMTSAGGLAVVETHIVGQGDGVPETIPVMRFWPGRELNNDPTSWWSPNLVCAERMLEWADLKPLKRVAQADRAAWLLRRA